MIMKKELFLSYFLCALCVLCGKIRRRFLGSIDAATKSGGNALAKHPGEPAQKPRLVSSNQLVLPNAQNPPACFAQCAIDPPVACFVAKDLGPPKCPVLFGPCRMDRATVPETSVNKHRQPQLRKNKIRLHGKGRDFRISLAETGDAGQTPKRSCLSVLRYRFPSISKTPQPCLGPVG